MISKLPDQVGEGTLLLRLWQPEDAELLHQAVLENVEHLRPWMAWIAHEPLTVAHRIDMIAEWRARWEQGAEVPMGMFDDGRVVGGTGYVRRPSSIALEIGYWVHVAHQGQGYATRATRLLTTAAFESGVVTEIEVHHDKANARSRRVPERLGFTFVGERVDTKVAPGEVGIDCGWRITRREWEGITRATPGSET